MANPFLVLGGVAVGIVVAAAGVLTVPGWIESAQNAAALNDLSHVAAGEAAAVTVVGKGYMSGAELTANADTLGMSFQLSGGVKLCVTRSTDAKAYAGVALSASGAYFARTPDHAKAQKGTTPEAALAAVGGLPAGVPNPVVDGDCAPGAEIISAGAGSEAGGGTSVPHAALGPVASDFYHAVDVAWTSYGVFTLDVDEHILRSGSDGLAHSVTGPAGAMAWGYGYGLTSDASGNLYAMSYNETYGAYVPYRIAPDGTVADLLGLDGLDADEAESRAYDFGATQMVAAPDGAVYVIRSGSDGDGEWKSGVARMTTDGYEYLETPGRNPEDLSVGGDGNIYFSDMYRPGVFKLTSSGSVSTVATKNEDGSDLLVGNLSAGSDGTVYFSKRAVIRKITASGVVSTVSTLPDNVDHIAAAPDGDVYYSLTYPGYIGKIAADGYLSAVMQESSEG